MRILQTSIVSSREKVVKCTNFERFHTHSNPIFKLSDLLQPDDHLILNILSLVYKATNNLIPSCFQDYFIYNSNIHGYETRQVGDDLYKKHRNTTMYGLRSMKYHGSSLWNNIHIFISASQSNSLFRTKLKAYGKTKGIHKQKPS